MLCTLGPSPAAYRGGFHCPASLGSASGRRRLSEVARAAGACEATAVQAGGDGLLVYLESSAARPPLGAVFSHTYTREVREHVRREG